MLIPDFSKARILVVGDVMLDKYWFGNSSRVSPEAPVPIIHFTHQEARLGGAANVAANITSLGGQATLMGYIGEDADGHLISALLHEHHIENNLVCSKYHRTISKLRVLAQNQQINRIDFEQDFGNCNSERLVNQLQAIVRDYDAVVFSDYAKGTLNSIRDLIQIAKDAKKPILVDPKSNNFNKYQYADFITPNWQEFVSITGPAYSDLEIFEQAQKILRDSQIGSLILTRGESGMSLVHANTITSFPTKAKEVFDVTGAGDTVLAVFALGIASGTNLYQTAELAMTASGIVVAKLGTSTVSKQELETALTPSVQSASKLVTQPKLRQIREQLKLSNKKLVMTNGCFDLLHAGHIEYLEKAKLLGDHLVVAVNSDSSVRTLKGPARPINTCNNRMKMLAALSCVDWVVEFEEITPAQLYEQITPDILVKGGDYRACEIVGYNTVKRLGGQIVTMPFLEGHSTTSIIERCSL